MSAKDTKLVIGGSPRADLLPPEIKIAERARGQRRGLVYLVVAVVVLIGAGYAFASITAQAAQDRLTAANNRSAELLAEQAKYIEVRQVMSELEAIQDAQAIGLSTEVAWAAFLQQIDAALPAGTTLVQIKMDSATPLADFSTPASTLEGYRIGDLTLTLVSPALIDHTTLLDRLSNVPGFVDIAIDDVVGVEGAAYTAIVTIHFDAKALTDRTLPTDDEAALAAERTAAEEAAAAEDDVDADDETGDDE